MAIVIYCISSLILSLPIGLILYLVSKCFASNRSFKLPIQLISLLAGFSIVYFHFFTSPAYNHEYATLKEKNNQYELVLSGERTLMSHDIFSVFSRRTYTESIRLILPRKRGIIHGYEIKWESRHPLTGTIQLDDAQLNVDLFLILSDSLIKKPLNFNGDYKLNRLNPIKSGFPKKR